METWLPTWVPRADHRATGHRRNRIGQGGRVATLRGEATGQMGDLTDVIVAEVPGNMYALVYGVERVRVGDVAETI